MSTNKINLDEFVITCNCGSTMIAVMGDETEYLFMCKNESCPNQFNMMTAEKSIRLLQDFERTKRNNN